MTHHVVIRCILRQVAVLQAAFDEQKRLESSSARDVRDMEVMLRGALLPTRVFWAREG